MGTAASTVPGSTTKGVVNFDKEALGRSRRIETELGKAKEEETRTIKLLLLGGAESGKSTFAKQMKILHLNGFTDTDLINYRYLIYSNVAMTLTQILRAVHELGVMPNGLSVVDIESFRSIAGNAQMYNYDLTQEMGLTMQNIWKSRAAQDCYERRSEFELLDSAKYFMDNLERISAKGYTPTVEDILRSRAATVGIYEICFQFKSYIFKMIDVGGQKTERRKWIHCFDKVTAVMFVTSASEYDQTLCEDNTTNRMQDSLLLFNSIMTNPIFLKTSALLFLNKKDILMEKVTTVPLNQCFPEYTGSNTYEAVSNYILKEFMKRKPVEKTMYSHFTVATDTKNVEVVFAASMDTILKKTLATFGV